MAPGAVRGSWEDPGECLGCGGYIGHACGKLKSNYHMQRHTHTHTRACGTGAVSVHQCLVQICHRAVIG